MFGNIGVPGLVLIVIAALIVFGPEKLPDIGKAVGSAVREFKRASSDISSNSKKKK